jgi:hypothetical protein
VAKLLKSLVLIICPFFSSGVDPKSAKVAPEGSEFKHRGVMARY